MLSEAIDEELSGSSLAEVPVLEQAKNKKGTVAKRSFIRIHAII